MHTERPEERKQLHVTLWPLTELLFFNCLASWQLCIGEKSTTMTNASAEWLERTSVLLNTTNKLEVVQLGQIHAR